MDIGVEFDRRFQVFSGPAESSLNVFRCGAKVRGQVCLIIPPPRPMRVQHVDLELSGDRILLGKHRLVTTLLEHRESLLFGGDQGVLLSPGRHTFPFVFSIPASLPSTFVGAHVQIQYLAKAVVESASELPLEVSEPFVIFSRPAPKHTRLQATAEHEGVVCKWKLERRNFQQNEFIFINADVVNKSRGPHVTALSALLSMEWAFRSPGGKWLMERQELCTFRDPVRLAKKQGRRWNGVSLHIPQLAPSSCDGEDNCSCKISYQIELTVERELKSISAHLKVPIVVGVEVPPHKILNRCPQNQSQFDSATEMTLSNRASENSSFRGTRAASFNRRASNLLTSEIEEDVVVKVNPLFFEEDDSSWPYEASTSKEFHK